jgi:hypothetical protein
MESEYVSEYVCASLKRERIGMTLGGFLHCLNPRLFGCWWKCATASESEKGSRNARSYA